MVVCELVVKRWVINYDSVRVAGNIDVRGRWVKGR
jgi:hypothetical protein